MITVFRVDASTDIGVGHVMRCATLADSLQARGVEVEFICREHAGHLLPWLGDAGFRVTGLPAPQSERRQPRKDYAGWLGVSQQTDAAESIAVLDGRIPDWVVVDHYGLGLSWEASIRPHAQRLMVIDDLANRAHDCDLLLDQNFLGEDRDRYDALVKEHCTLLLGPRYALLRPDYLKYRHQPRARMGPVQRVFVFFGGSDPVNMTGRTLEALSHPSLQHLDVDIVIGANNPHRHALLEQAAARPRTAVYGLQPHLAQFMHRADIGVGAAGVTTWERMCIGLPSLVVSMAENQRPAARALGDCHLIRYLGDAAGVGVSELTEALRLAASCADELAEESQRGRLLVDGFGVARVAECLHPTETSNLSLRNARSDDASLYFDWVNDPEVRRQSIDTRAIAWPEHLAWFEGKLRDSHSRLFVLEAERLPVGQIRFDLENGEASIDYSIDPQFRRRRWGTHLVALGLTKLCRGHDFVFRAWVKVENEASASVFSRLGFRETAGRPDAGLREFRFDSKAQSLCQRY